MNSEHSSVIFFKCTEPGANIYGSDFFIVQLFYRILLTTDFT
jgi:hypothetical protein